MREFPLRRIPLFLASTFVCSVLASAPPCPRGHLLDPAPGPFVPASNQLHKANGEERLKRQKPEGGLVTGLGLD